MITVYASMWDKDYWYILIFLFSMQLWVDGVIEDNVGYVIVAFVGLVIAGIIE